MYGIQAINAANGWAMAVAGGCIVISGLTVLSLIISQLHKIVGWMEKSKTEAPENTTPAPDTARALVIPEKMPEDILETAAIYQSLSEPIGATFELANLYRACAEHRLPHAHLTIRSLRDAGLLLPSGDGLFCWKNG